MEEMNLRTIIQGIQAVLKDMEYTRYMIKVTPPHKRGKYQTHVIHLQYLFLFVVFIAVHLGFPIRIIALNNLRSR